VAQPEGTVAKPEAKSRRALLWTSTTYFGEGLPWSFLHQMGAEFLTAIGASNAQVGMTSALHGAVTLKFLWSPIVDLFGTKRGWVVTTQLALGAGMLVLAGISPAPGPGFLWFWAAASLFAIVHATHDIACDGFYMQALNKHAQRVQSFANPRPFWRDESLPIASDTARSKYVHGTTPATQRRRPSESERIREGVHFGPLRVEQPLVYSPRRGPRSLRELRPSQCTSRPHLPGGRPQLGETDR
jgi:hypothetical protein